VCCYGGHSSEVLRVAWHPSGRLLATGGAEGAVRLWRADGLGDGGDGSGDAGGGGGGGPPPSASAAVTYAPPTDPLDSEHPEEIYAMIFASRGGGGAGDAPSPQAAADVGSGTGGGGGGGASSGGGLSGGELLLTASAEAIYVWDLETGKLLQGAPSPEARVLGTGAERVAMPPWRGPRSGRAGAEPTAGAAAASAPTSPGGSGKGLGDDGDGDEGGEQAFPPANYPTEMPVYVFGMAQVGGAGAGAGPGPSPAPASLLAAGCCDGTLRLWAFEPSAASVRPLFASQAHAPGDMASFVTVLAPISEASPAGGGGGAAGAGGPYVVSVSRGGQATVFDARKLVAAGATAGVMGVREALSAGVVQRHWLDGPTMGGAAVAAAGRGRPLMLAAVGADGLARCYEARALLQPALPDSDGDGGEGDGDGDGGGGGGGPRGPGVLRPARILRAPGPALGAPLLAVAASADGGAVAAAGFAVKAGPLSREERRLEALRAAGGAAEGGAAVRSVRRGGASSTVVAGRRRRDRPAVGTAAAVMGGGGGDDGGGDDGEGGLFAAPTIGTSYAAASAAARRGGKEEREGGGADEEDEDEDEEEGEGGGAGAGRPKCEGESIAARAAVFVWRLGDD